MRVTCVPQMRRSSVVGSDVGDHLFFDHLQPFVCACATPAYACSVYTTGTFVMCLLHDASTTV